jgi:hypothetical protein
MIYFNFSICSLNSTLNNLHKYITILTKSYNDNNSKSIQVKRSFEQLGIKEINEGTSTGLNHFSNGAILESYSPADGQLIAKVKTSTADYEK